VLFVLLFLPLPFSLYALRDKNLRRLSLLGAAVPLVSIVLALLGYGDRQAALHLDGVGLFYLVIADALFALVALYALAYFETAGDARAASFFAPFFLFLFATHGAFLAHNLGLMWTFVEGSTLASALLVYHHRDAHALEATWKYLMLGSVGVALSLVGVILVYALLGGATLDWQRALELSAGADPARLKLAYAFLLIGFGTKVGLFPMHAWLPDAHSEAPSPGSALLSGTLLNVAFYALLRYTALMAPAGLAGFAHGLLLAFGLASLLAAGLFMFAQRDYKRLLAYSSMEHMGLAVYALGLGVPWLAMLHTLFHSLAKTAAFLSFGNVLLAYRTKSMARVGGLMQALPGTGALVTLSLVALAGLPPFALFYAEFQALWHSPPLLMVLYLAGLSAAFAAVVIPIGSMVFGTLIPPRSVPQKRALLAVPAFLLAVVVLLGLFPPTHEVRMLAEVLTWKP